MRQLGVFMTIPFILAVPPVLGWFIGKWLDEKFNSKPFFMYLLILLGFMAGFREVYRIIKRFGDGA
jgi:ATP synthase protein I